MRSSVGVDNDAEDVESVDAMDGAKYETCQREPQSGERKNARGGNGR